MTVLEFYEKERALVGGTLGPTAWRIVTQEDIDQFGACTHDPDPMHIDPEWARENSPFGQTIAFGFWTLSMMTSMLQEAYRMAGDPPANIISANYGCDRLRFVEPVLVGQRIRLEATLHSVEMPKPDRVLRHVDVNIWGEGAARPAVVARWLSMSVWRSDEFVQNGFRAQ
ncbi:MAG: nodulation protein NodN [Parvularcula sp.]|nr:nodulation protein NodN [Parvularcula sp.]